MGFLTCIVMGIRSDQAWTLLLTHMLWWHDGSDEEVVAVESSSSNVFFCVASLTYQLPNKRKENKE